MDCLSSPSHRGLEREAVEFTNPSSTPDLHQTLQTTNTVKKHLVKKKKGGGKALVASILIKLEKWLGNLHFILFLAFVHPQSSFCNNICFVVADGCDKTVQDLLSTVLYNRPK